VDGSKNDDPNLVNFTTYTLGYQEDVKFSVKMKKNNTIQIRAHLPGTHKGFFFKEL
jgi:hypothetical protein